MPLVKSLAASGDLALWHDYRSGHCANQAGYSAGAFDGVVAGTAGRFRTGVGYETSHNCLGSPTNILVDGDMEAAGVGDWTAGDGVATKEHGTPHSGTHCLRVTSNGVGPKNPAVTQVILSAGKSYILKGYTRSDGVEIPSISDWTQILWSGSNSSSWQYFTATFVAGTSNITFQFSEPASAGTEYVEFDDITVTELSLSNGYIRVLDNALFYPPTGGMCLVASYLQSSAADDCQIIGQGADLATNTSWQLKRTATQIQFVTSDNVNLATFNHNAAAVPGQIETVTVRYTGGAVGNNCTISVLTPIISATTGLAGAVPQNVAQPVSIGSYSNSAAYPFFGTMRYCAFIRGAQTAATLAALAAELEDINWPDAVEVYDTTGSVADRAVQYMSKFGVDASIADEGGVVNGPLSNSGWVFGTAAGAANGFWRVAPYHSQNAAAGGPADVQKGLWCTSDSQLRLPRERFSVDTTAGLAAYGTWDFWVYHQKASTTDTFVVHDINGANDDGYLVRLNTKVILGIVSGGVYTDLISTGVVLSVAQLIHIRVTRTVNGTWRLFYQLCDPYGVPGRWVYVGTVVDATIVTSDGMFLNYDKDDALMIGNHRSEKALFKWRGVVDAL